MFERFTDRARRSIVLANTEAQILECQFIDTEHMLLGLLSESEGVAAVALKRLDLTRGDVLDRLAYGAKEEGETVYHSSRPFTPEARKVMELSVREALQLGHNYIGTEHILLGLTRLRTGVANEILIDHCGSLENVRNAVVKVLSGYSNPFPLLKLPEPWSTLSGPDARRVIDWIKRFDNTNGPISSDHPLALVKDALLVSLGEA